MADSAPTPEEEASILSPDMTVHLASGEAVVVREFRWGEALRLGALVRPIADAVAGSLGRGELEMSELWGAMEDSPQAFLELVAHATGKPIAWVEGLSEDDGQRLAAGFWTVQRGFFGRVVSRAWARQVRDARRSAPGSCSPPSPDSGTVPPT